MINLIAKLRGALYSAKFHIEQPGVAEEREDVIASINEALDASAGKSPRYQYSASVFCVHEGHILLVFHRMLQKWLPPGGEQEAYETPLQTAIRELREETGYESVVFPTLPGAPLCSPPGYLAYQEVPGGIKGTFMNHDFVALVPHKRVKIDNSLLGVKWIRPDQVDELDTPQSVKDMVKKIAGYMLTENWP